MGRGLLGEWTLYYGDYSSEPRLDEDNTPGPSPSIYQAAGEVLCDFIVDAEISWVVLLYVCLEAFTQDRSGRNYIRLSFPAHFSFFVFLCLERREGRTVCPPQELHMVEIQLRQHGN